LSVLANTLQKSLAVKLEKWVGGGQYEQVFDNEQDTLTLSRFQCFDFEGMDRYPELIEPLLFYILHRANAYIYSPEAVTTFKTFFIDEAWRFFGHPGHSQARVHLALCVQRGSQLSPSPSERVGESCAGPLIATANGPVGARNA
jgi:type IV secretory pathway VirB4 component